MDVRRNAALDKPSAATWRAPDHIRLSFDVDAYEIFRGGAGEAYGVFAFAASEFEYDRVVVLEIFMPAAFQRKTF